MEHDNEDDTTSNVVMELEEAIQMVNETPNLDVPINMDKAMNDQLLALPSPRVSVSMPFSSFSAYQTLNLFYVNGLQDFRNKAASFHLLDTKEVESRDNDIILVNSAFDYPGPTLNTGGIEPPEHDIIFLQLDPSATLA